MVRPCSCPASKRSWQGAPKTRSTRHVSNTQYRDRRDRHRYRQELVPPPRANLSRPASRARSSISSTARGTTRCSLPRTSFAMCFAISFARDALKERLKDRWQHETKSQGSWLSANRRLRAAWPVHLKDQCGEIERDTHGGPADEDRAGGEDRDCRGALASSKRHRNAADVSIGSIASV